MLQQNGKYLYVSYEKEEGRIDSKIRDLELLINTALSMKRIPVIRQDRILVTHNNSVKNVPIDWKQYIDFPKTRILKIESGKIRELPDILQYIYEQDFNLNSYSENQIRHINTNQLYDEENKQYPVIYLSKNINIKRLWEIIPKSYMNLNYTDNIDADYKSSFLIILSLSREVNDLTDIVLNYFGTTRTEFKLISGILYSSIKLNSIYVPIGWDEKLDYYVCICLRYKKNGNVISELVNKYTVEGKLKRCIMKIRQKVSSHVPLYVNSSMIANHHFDFLKSMSGIYRYTDFKELKERFGANEIRDHNLLYLVENNIMRYALVKVFPSRMNRFVFEGSWYYNPPGLQQSLIQGGYSKLKGYMNRLTKL